MTWALVTPLLATLLLPLSLPVEREQERPAESGSLDIRGEVALTALVFPRRDVAELRPRASIEIARSIGSRWRARLDADVEALAAGRDGFTGDVTVRVREAWIEASAANMDIRAGIGRVVWGRLDEIQPSDVVNPLDTARFVIDGRSEARRAVSFVRARWFFGERLTIEGVIAPVFRRATFDELGEPTSPFNLLNDVVRPALLEAASPGVDRREPATTWRNVSGGARALATFGRVDVGLSVFRGFDGFGVVSFEPIESATGPVAALVAPEPVAPLVIGRLIERFPRFTMVGADAEVVIGGWEIRGEAAYFVEKTIAPGVAGRAIDVGLGLNRAVGGLRYFVSVLVHHEAADAALPSLDRTDVTMIGSVERSFGRERYLARVFAAATPTDRTAFARALFGWRVRDDVSVEMSAATFAGEGETLLGRFRGRDFVLARLRVGW